MKLYEAEQRIAATQREPRKPLSLSEEKWRQTADVLVQYSSQFLLSMRKLQKVVHRKEANVSKEKQEFEQAKKDFEVTLKSAQRQLETHNVSLGPGDSSDRPVKQSSAHKTFSTDRQRANAIPS